MKIRTDFVTNSSSSCFCVQLLLQFDNQYALYMDANLQKGDPDVYFEFAECKIIHAFSGKSLYTHDLASNFADIIKFRNDLPSLFEVASDMASGGLNAAVVEQVCSTATKLDHAYLIAHVNAQGEYAYTAETYSMLDIDVENAYVDTRTEEENIQMLKDAGLEPLGDEVLEELIQAQGDDESGDQYDLSKTIAIHMTPDGNVSADIDYGSCSNPLRRIRIAPEHDIAALGKYPGSMKAACRAGKSLQDMIQAAQASIYPGNTAIQAAHDEIVENLDRTATVSFAGKHFLLSGFRDCAEELIADIEKRGGIVHVHLAKEVDYLVVRLESHKSANIKKVLAWRNSGAHTLIISDYQLVSAILQTSPLDSQALRLLQDELMQRKSREQEKDRLAMLEQRRISQKAQMQREEERRREKQEKAQRAAEEKLRLRKERERELAEKKRAAAVEAKAQKERERQEAIAKATILYAPGQEPEHIRWRIHTLFEKLDAAYPNRVISGLYNDHKKWGETLTGLRLILGYADNTSLLEAYGYTVVRNENKGGRPTTVNPDEVIAELQRRYPNGAGRVSLATLQKDNPDLPWKTLQNKAIDYFGKTLVAHLKEIGILGGAETHAPISDGNRDQ